MQERIFKIQFSPTRSTLDRTLAQFLAQMPVGFGWEVSGRLEPSPGMDPRLLLPNTGYHLGPYGVSDGFLRPVDAGKPIDHADVAGVTGCRLLPRFVEFDRTGRFGQHPPHVINEAKRVAAEHCATGYRGQLTFSVTRGLYVPAQVALWAPRSGELSLQRVLIQWHSELSESVDAIAPAVTLCEELGFAELTPPAPVQEESAA